MKKTNWVLWKIGWMGYGIGMVSSCAQSVPQKPQSFLKEERIENNAPLVPVDVTDEHYKGYPLGNQLTPEGWRITYLVRKDTTKYQDIYIECSKESVKRVYKGAHLLHFRTYFIPIFAGENEDCLFLTHACATSCAAVLIFHKKEKQFQDYEVLVQYDLKNSVLVTVPEQEDMSPLTLKIIDLKKKQEREVRFKNLCEPMCLFKGDCIETIRFSNRIIEIDAHLIDINDEERVRKIKERQRIEL